ncbi:MAG: helix-turn-helix transcriptional regulator [Lachnospiraceae bacterium]|nr:helix-turn-helix transcriptional regulator [Lachnospiraceae bacterium]
MMTKKDLPKQGVDDLLGLFEDSVEVEDILAAQILGEVSAAIVKKRLGLGMTQKEFAKYVGVSQGMVSRWEGGDYNFTIRNLVELSAKLDLSLDVSMKSQERQDEKKYKGKIYDFYGRKELRQE